MFPRVFGSTPGRTRTTAINKGNMAVSSESDARSDVLPSSVGYMVSPKIESLTADENELIELWRNARLVDRKAAVKELGRSKDCPLR